MKKLFVFNNSIFKRMFIILVAIMIPVYTLGFLMYNEYVRSRTKDITNSMVVNGSFFINSIENEITRVTHLQYDCIYDDNLLKIVNMQSIMTEYEKLTAIISLQQRLLAIKNSSLYVKDLYALIPSINKVIHANGSVDILNPADYDDLYKDSKNALGAISYENDSPMFFVVPVTVKTTNYKPEFIIVLELSVSELIKSLSELNFYEDTGAFISLENGRLLFYEKMDDLYGNILKSYKDISPEELMRKAQESKYATYINDNQKNNLIKKVKNLKTVYITTLVYSDILKFNLYAYIPTHIAYKETNRYLIWFIIYTLLAILVILSYTVSVYKIVYVPLKKLLQAFRDTEDGNLDIKIEHLKKDEFGYLYSSFNRMTTKLHDFIQQVYTQKILVQKSQLKQLQSQINPHFLYNSFFILHRMISGDNKEAAEKFSEQLGIYFRYVTRIGQDDVPLIQDVQHARIYADTQLMRYSRRIKLLFNELMNNYKNILVPRLILQPIIENAFEHGLKNIEKDGLLVVKFEEHEDMLHIIVEDNGQDFDDQTIQIINSNLENIDNLDEYTGLYNIHKRLKLKYSNRSGLKVSRSELGGMKVSMILDVNIH